MAGITISGSRLGAFARARREGMSASGGEMIEEARTAPMRLQWLDDKDDPVGETFELEPPQSELAEGFAPDGRIGAEPVFADIGLDIEPPADARRLLMMWGNDPITIAREELGGFGVLPGDPVIHNFPDEDRAFLYPVFSDGFLDAEEFFGHVRDLTDWILQQPPFDRPELETRFGMKAFFWRAPGAGISHFGAPLTGEKICTAGTGTPVLMGSREAAAALIGDRLHDGQGLILMNSSQRGGAGGSAPHDFPAWASIDACPGEDWRRIALHEMGHSLGLEDEYVLPDLPVYQPWRDLDFEVGANATSKKNPASAPWKTMLNLGGDESQPTVGVGEQDLGWADPRPGGKPLIGTIAGAHYHEKYFRPSADCLMRSLAADHFCAVCQRHIVKQLT
jgi:hypothetical protein